MRKNPGLKEKKPKADAKKPAVDPLQPDKETGTCCFAENVCHCDGDSEHRFS